MKKFLVVLFLAFASLVPAKAQIVPYAGQTRFDNEWVGPNFGRWAQRVASGSTTAGTYSITIQGPGYVTAGGNQSFTPFVANRVRITVGVGAVRETVTPTVVSGCTVGSVNVCVVTAAFAFAHGPGTPIVSGSCGFDEANVVANQNGGGIVLFDNFGGCTATTITSSTACFTTNTISSQIPNGTSGGPFYYVTVGGVCTPSQNPGFGPSGPPMILLASAATYGGLAQAGITTTGTNTVCGNIGSNPTGTVTGTFTFTCGGTQTLAQPRDVTAQADLLAAFNAITATPCTVTLGTAVDIGGQTLTPGTYCAPSSIGITGTTTFDAQNNPNAVFIVKAVSTIISATSAHIVLANGAKASRIFWQPGSSATLGTSTTWNGAILSAVSDTINGGAGATVAGSVFAGSAGNNTGAITVSAGPTTITSNSNLPL